MKTLTLFLFCASFAFAGDLPDAPSVQKKPLACQGCLADSGVKIDSIRVVDDTQRPDGFFAFRTSFEAPALRPNKKSWAIFALSHAAAWGALAAANHQKEHWGSEAPGLGVVTVMDFVMLKCVSPSLSIEGAGWAVQHYLRAR
jgi:hypothetical protein